MRSLDKKLVAEIALYFLILVIGVALLAFPAFGLISPIYYVSVLFYAIAFISIIVYFVGRKEKDYETLFLSLICILVGSFMFLLQNGKTPLVLGTGITIFTFLFITNKGYKIRKLKKEKNYMWLIEFVVTFLVGFLGILTIINLFKELTDVATLLFGYYFITLGIMCIAVPFFKMFFDSDLFDKILKSIVLEDKKVNKK